MEFDQYNQFIRTDGVDDSDFLDPQNLGWESQAEATGSYDDVNLVSGVEPSQSVQSLPQLEGNVRAPLMPAVRALPRTFANKVSPNRIGKKAPVRSVPQQRTVRPVRPVGAGSAGPNASTGWRPGGERAVQRRLQPSSLTTGRPMEYNVLRQEVNSLKNELQNVNELCRSLLDRQDNFEKTFSGWEPDTLKWMQDTMLGLMEAQEQTLGHTTMRP